jgi:predicted thioesterase
VTVNVTVSSIEGRKVTLDAQVRDAVEIVGRGVHVRYVIDVARQTQRVEEKRKLIEEKLEAGRAPQ